MRVCAIGLLITGVACGGSTAPATFSAQYTLVGVQPTPGVPTAGQGGKNVQQGCMEVRTDGTLIQAVVYLNDATFALSIETETWSYHLVGGEIVVTDPQGLFLGVTSIGSTGDSQISTNRTLQNAGMPVARTLIFTKVGGLGSVCGSVQWRGF